MGTSHAHVVKMRVLLQKIVVNTKQANKDKAPQLSTFAFDS